MFYFLSKFSRTSCYFYSPKLILTNSYCDIFIFYIGDAVKVDESLFQNLDDLDLDDDDDEDDPDFDPNISDDSA